MSSNVFEISYDTVLDRYHGTGEVEVIVPDCVEVIWEEAFADCQAKTIILPETLGELLPMAFRDCTNLIEITVPDEVPDIRFRTFWDCTSLARVSLPGSIEEVDESAFVGCTSLSEVCFRGYPVFSIKLSDGEKEPRYTVFYEGETFPEAFSIKSDGVLIAPNIPYDAIDGKKVSRLAYAAGCIANNNSLVANNTEFWKYAKSQGKKIAGILGRDPEEIKSVIVEHMENAKNPSACENAVTDVEPYVQEHLSKRKIPQEIVAAIREGISRKDGSRCSAEALRMLVTGCQVTATPSAKQPRKYSEYAEVTVSEEAWEIASWLDLDELSVFLEPLVFKKAIRSILPALCVFARGKVLDKTIEFAKKTYGESNTERRDIRIARGALMHNESDSIMELANNMGLLEEYARIRNTAADVLRDRELSNFGFSKDGIRKFNLDGRTLEAHLSTDLSIELIDVASGKKVKSVPKKNVDPTAYDQVKSELDKLKKSLKLIIKQRKDLLFSDFLSGRTREAADWQMSYIDNPVLASVARLIVWQQGDNTFSLKDGSLIKVDGSPYQLEESAVKVAHPIEMTPETVAAWRNYFVDNSLQQPFPQIWERTVPEGLVKSDRYKGLPIPFYRFRNREKHGIMVTDRNFHDDIDISFTDCMATVERLDYGRHSIQNDDRFEITSFSILNYTRMANHIVALLDQATIFTRIASNDLSVADEADNYTLEELIGFIDAATKAGSTELATALMNARAELFPKFNEGCSLVLE